MSVSSFLSSTPWCGGARWRSTRPSSCRRPRFPAAPPPLARGDGARLLFRIAPAARSSPIFAEEIRDTGRDYVALGHQHVRTDVSQGAVTAFYAGAPFYASATTRLTISPPPLTVIHARQPLPAVDHHHQRTR